MTNYTKYTIPLLALVILISAGMNSTFAQEPGEEDFVDVGPVGNTGAAYHELRIDAKKQDIKDTGDEMKALYDRIFELEATLTDLNSEGIVNERHDVKDILDVLYAEADTLQEKAYEHFEIPEDRHQKLLDIKEGILEQYKDTTLLNDVFIDYLDESVQVILHSDYFESHKNSVLDTIDSIASDKFEDVTGEIIIGVKHFTASTVTGGDLMCSEFERRANNRNIVCEQVTIAFPATRGSDNGFVTVGHAFGRLLSDTAGTPTYQAKVYQPGPDFNNVDGSAVVPVGQSLSDRAWQATVIGKLNYGVSGRDNSNNSDDAAFVKLLPGKTIDRKVIHYNIDYDITSYHTGNPTIGHYVYKSGAATDTTFGFIRSVNIDNVYASYQQCRGDSGAPIGTVSRGEFTIYGMHLGLADDDTHFNQPSCSQNNIYSKFITYDKIVDLIGITGQH